MKRVLFSLLTFLSVTGAWAQGTDYQIGTTGTSSGTSGVPTPFEDYFEGDRTQSLFLASELRAKGMGPGFIYAIKFNVLNIASSATIWGWNLTMGTTTANQITSWLPNITTPVFSAGATTPYNPGNGVKTYTLPTPFFWNGIDNIVIQTCHGYSGRSNSWSSNADVAYHSTSFQSTYNYRTDGQGSLCSYSGSVTPLYNRITTTFNWGPAGMNNASAALIVNPTGKFCPGVYNVAVRIKNNGQNRINNVKVYWELDGILQPVINHNTMIDTFTTSGSNEAQISLGNVSFAGSDRVIKVYTSDPNGVRDTVNLDDTLKVSLGPAPKSTITPDGPTIFCTAGTINVNLVAPPGAGSVYQWYKDGQPIPGAANPSYRATMAGDYTVRIDSNGCSNMSDITRVENLAMPLPVVHPSGYPVLCSGDSVTLVANAGVTGASYQWQFQGANLLGATNASLTVTNPGNYNVVTSKYVCAASSPGINVVPSQRPAPYITALTDGTLMTDPTFVTYQWQKDGIDIAGANNFAYKATTAGSYTVWVSNGGCDETSPAHLVGTTGISNTTVSGNVSIYPNPAKNVVYVSTKGNAKAIISGIDGKELITQDVTAQGINIGNLSAGIYIIRVVNSDGSTLAIEKLMKAE